jgi:hypothetical protein
MVHLLMCRKFSAVREHCPPKPLAIRYSLFAVQQVRQFSGIEPSLSAWLSDRKFKHEIDKISLEEVRLVFERMKSSGKSEVEQ